MAMPASVAVAVAVAAVRDSMQDWAAWAARRQHSAFPKARDALLALDAASGQQEEVVEERFVADSCGTLRRASP